RFSLRPDEVQRGREVIDRETVDRSRDSGPQRERKKRRVRGILLSRRHRLLEQRGQWSVQRLRDSDARPRRALRRWGFRWRPHPGRRDFRTGRGRVSTWHFPRGTGSTRCLVRAAVWRAELPAGAREPPRYLRDQRGEPRKRRRRDGPRDPVAPDGP